jgi:hypothetical protein
LTGLLIGHSPGYAAHWTGVQCLVPSSAASVLDSAWSAWVNVCHVLEDDAVCSCCATICDETRGEGRLWAGGAALASLAALLPCKPHDAGTAFWKAEVMKGMHDSQFVVLPTVLHFRSSAFVAKVSCHANGS